jgi:hypothetical protein
MAWIASGASRGWLGLGWLALAMLALAACSAAQDTARPAVQDARRAAAQPAEAPALGVGLPTVVEDWRRVDDQGAVQVTVVPINLAEGSPAELAFEVMMNTHSVDLTMDLAQLSTLRTDTGKEVGALSWSGGSGHHVRGTLVFPARDAEGEPLLLGAGRLTLIIRQVDVPERVFEWTLQGGG